MTWNWTVPLASATWKASTASRFRPTPVSKPWPDSCSSGWVTFRKPAPASSTRGGASPYWRWIAIASPACASKKSPWHKLLMTPGASQTNHEAAVARLLLPHAFEQVGGSGIVFAKSVGEIAVDAFVFFFEGDGERENRAFGEAIETAHTSIVMREARDGLGESGARASFGEGIKISSTRRFSPALANHTTSSSSSLSAFCKP